MSRQYDEYMSDKFEINGELYSVIEPTNFQELIKAYEIKDMLQNQFDASMNDDLDGTLWLNILEEQNDYIKEYLNSIGNFDNYYLINNIIHLSKKSGLGIGDLENALGISAGYISRTAKADSKKKLSIDVVWKIATFFEVNVDDLISGDLSEPESNTELIAKFLDKLFHQTYNGSVEWEIEGGVMCYLNKKYEHMGLFTEEGNKCIYHPNHLNPDIEWILSGDVFSCKNLFPEREFVIIPYIRENDTNPHYDFIFTCRSKDNSDNSYKWEKAFYSMDDRYEKVRTHAATLYKAIMDKEDDAKVSPETRKFILDYLK